MEKKSSMQDMVPRRKPAAEHDIGAKKVPINRETRPKSATSEFLKRKPPAKREPENIKRWFADEERGIAARKINRRSLKLIITAVIFGLSAIILGGLKILSSVTVEVFPREEFIEVNTFVKVTRSGSGGLSLETVKFEEEFEKSAKVSGVKNIERHAAGRIIIYNTFSKDPQILVRRTRFEAPGGKIYRIKDNITVPGADPRGNQLEPGSIEADVVADAPGETFNIGLTDFTIPGFKGTARFEKFYARSKTPMTGGFSGTSPVISEEEISALESSIKGDFKIALNGSPLGALKAERIYDCKNLVCDVTDLVRCGSGSGAGCDARPRHPPS